MNELKVFTNEKFGSVRTLEQNNEIYFVGKDVAEALGYKNTRDALNKFVDEIDKSDVAIHDGRQNRNMIIINESGLYALIFGSKLESAKEFKHWVTSEVLPSIRKTGGYLHGQETMSDAELMAKALMVAQKQIEEKNNRIEEMKPKEIFADAVSASNSSILIGDLAKLIKQNGHDIGQKRLFEWMREKGYLMKTGSSRNLPTQRSMEMGLFGIKESTVINPDGSNRLTKTTKVTGKGQVYFINKFIA